MQFFGGNEKELPENQGKIRNQTRIQSEKKSIFMSGFFQIFL